MPPALRNQARGERIELDSDALLLARGINAEAAAQDLSDGKIGRAPKAFRSQLHLAHARQGKRPQLPAFQILREQVPLIFQTTEVIRPDAARLVAAALQFPIFELQFDAPEHALADSFEQLQIGHAGARAAERDRVLQIVPGKRDAVLEPVREFPKRRMKRPLERRPLVLPQRLLRDEQRRDLAL